MHFCKVHEGHSLRLGSQASKGRTTLSGGGGCGVMRAVRKSAQFRGFCCDVGGEVQVDFGVGLESTSVLLKCEEVKVSADAAERREETRSRECEKIGQQGGAPVEVKHRLLSENEILATRADHSGQLVVGYVAVLAIAQRSQVREETAHDFVRKVVAADEEPHELVEYGVHFRGG